MARRKKKLDYFPLDSDFFSDKKIKIVLARYGADGIALYLYLLCEIYKNSYYLEVDEDFYYVVSADLNMSADKVKQVLTFLLGRSLFDDKLFQSDAVLTSAGIQKQYQESVYERAKKNPVTVKKYWLLSPEETQPYIKVTHYQGESAENASFSRENKSNSRENDTKESKGKKSKVEERKLSFGGDGGNVFSVFEKCGFQMTGYTAETLAELTDTYSEEWVCEAIKRATERGHKHLGYVRGILNSWQTAGAMDEANSGKGKAAQSANAGTYVPEPNTPKKYVPPEEKKAATGMPEEMRKKWKT